MIKFFRHIRQRLLSENKYSKYLLYAMGEIILVVIGILIALQINTWNEGRKSTAKEIQTLKQLNVDLKQNQEELLDILYWLKKANTAGSKILNHLENETKTTDSLKLWMEVFTLNDIFNNANTTYKNIENSNENLISNDSLRLKVTLIYERDFENVHKRETRLVENKVADYRREASKHLKVGKAQFKFIQTTQLAVNTPVNFLQLKKSEAYKIALTELYNYRLLRFYHLEKTMLRLENLIKEVDNEIQFLQSK